MLTDKQKEALKAVLELHRDNKMTDEQVLTVVEALTESVPNLVPVPYSPIWPESQTWITYKSTSDQVLK